MSKEKTNEKKSSTLLTVIGAILCIILIPLLIMNCALIVKSYVNKDAVPDLGGICPMIVLTDSMNSPDQPEVQFASGDLIFVRTAEPEDIGIGDVITFFDPAGNGTSVVTHMVIAIDEEDDGSLSFTTKGTNNNTADLKPVPESKLIGTYTGHKIKGAGSVAMFMQSTVGLVVCVVVPIILLVLFDRLRMKKYTNSEKQTNAELYAELEELRALRAEKAKAEAAAGENSSDT